MNRDETLKFIAAKDLLTLHEGAVLIQEYIFDRTGKRVVISAINLNQDLFEKAVTVASNYYTLCSANNKGNNSNQ